MLGLTVLKGTARGQNGGCGGPARGPVVWVSSRGSAPSSAPGPMARGVKTSWEETWSIVSVTSNPAEVSPLNSKQSQSVSQSVIVIACSNVGRMIEL